MCNSEAQNLVFTVNAIDNSKPELYSVHLLKSEFSLSSVQTRS